MFSVIKNTCMNYKYVFKPWCIYNEFIMPFVNITHDSNIAPSILRSEIIFVLSVRQPIWHMLWTEQRWLTLCRTLIAVHLVWLHSLWKHCSCYSRYGNTFLFCKQNVKLHRSSKRWFASHSPQCGARCQSWKDLTQYSRRLFRLSGLSHCRRQTSRGSYRHPSR